ncbi:MAG: AraC family transcriptional regulator [Rikenellaceae bacterium]
MTNVRQNRRNKFRYLVANERDEQYGIIVTTVGCHDIAPEESYPPMGLHPNDYHFNINKGRILHEYQLVYITRGCGVLKIENGGETMIQAGDLFMLQPMVRHTYTPCNEGWREHWIGFKGYIIDEIVKRNFVPSLQTKYTPPLLKIGHNERIIDLYKKAIDIADEERAGYQQALGGIVMHILGLAMYRHKVSNVDNIDILERVEQAKIIMRDNIHEGVDLHELAERVNMSYSHFRRTFKQVVGTSPLYYYGELKINEAKLLLTTTDASIKEISFKLAYSSPEQFMLAFKKRVGRTPSEYRSLK